MSGIYKVGDFVEELLVADTVVYHRALPVVPVEKVAVQLDLAKGRLSLAKTLDGIPVFKTDMRY